MPELAAFIAYYAGLTGLLLAAGHRFWLTWIATRPADAPMFKPLQLPGGAPFVTIQIPVFNERFVVQRILRSLAALEYERDRFEVQILDDSEDDTSDLIAREVPRLAMQGISVRHIRRESRSGYKAGALAAGTVEARGEFVAIFDADFVPPPMFLRQAVGAFADPNVGVVQARWGYLNEDESRLTQAQAAMLDAHFEIEQAARFRRGYFLNFNGTAGMWRKKAIESAGGWRAATLTEDLDLSFRVQLAGWSIVYLPDLVVPSELPSHFSSFRIQQFRWAKGSAQTLRKMAKPLLRQKLPLGTRMDALVHLTGHFAYAAVLLILFSFPWVLNARGMRSVWNGSDSIFFGFSTISVLWFFCQPQKTKRKSAGNIIQTIAVALTLGVAMAIHNTAATLDGLVDRSGIFVRTPKKGNSNTGYREQAGGRAAAIVRWLEGFLSLYLLGCLVWFVRSGRWLFVPLGLYFFLAASLPAMAAWRAALLPRLRKRGFLDSQEPMCDSYTEAAVQRKVG